MTTNGAVTERTPLSVLLFHAAMSGNMSVSDFAAQLNIGAISLRQFIEGNTQRPRQKTLDLIGNTLNLTSDEVRRRMALVPEAGPRFGEWLEHHMKGSGYSRAKLTRATKISDGALRNYLGNNTLPDADQAQRLAEVLGVAPLEVANLVVAQTISKNGGALASAEAAPSAEFAPVALAGLDAELGARGEAVAAASRSPDEQALLGLWRQLHPQGRRATFSYIAMLLAER